MEGQDRQGSRRKRLLLLTTDDPARPGGGREMLSRLLHDLLAQLFEQVDTRRFTGSSRPIDGLRGCLHGLDQSGQAALVQAVRSGGYDQVFIDGSNLGAAAMALRLAMPDLPITTFFHNCETSFFMGALQARPGPRALGVLLGNWRAERLALRHSDTAIVLSERDSTRLRQLCGRSGDAILPLALADSWRPVAQPIERPAGYVLFVGGGFHGNLGGLEWFARKIAPRLSVPTLAVGRGLEALRDHLPESVELVGGVDDLAPWYAGARLVVAPILAGSGMKTKVAEALMHGKRVIGTTEAFAGYGAGVLAANRCVDEVEDFVGAIEVTLSAQPLRFDPALRALYEQDHSPTAALTRLDAILR
jgi:glycosyltransferase involved in cell wall biosynthesis